MRVSAGFTSAAGTTALPMGSLYAPAGQRIWLREVSVSATTATGFAVALRRATSVGGTHAAVDEHVHDDSAATPLGTVFNTDTGTAPTLTAGNLRVFQLGDAKGSGVIWTFGERGIAIPAGTGNGVVVIGLASPAACMIDFTWDE